MKYKFDSICKIILAVFLCNMAMGQVVDPSLDVSSSTYNKTSVMEKLTNSKENEELESELNNINQKKQFELKKNELILKLKELKVQDFKNFSDELQQLREQTVLYIENKKKECIGEFSTIIINDIGENELVKRKLTKEERKICLHDLKSFNAFYISRIIDSKKEFLKLAYDKQLVNMEKAKDQLLDELEVRFKQIEQQLSTNKRFDKKNASED